MLDYDPDPGIKIRWQTDTVFKIWSDSDPDPDPPGFKIWIRIMVEHQDLEFL